MPPGSCATTGAAQKRDHASASGPYDGAERHITDRNKPWDSAEKFAAKLARQDARFCRALQRAIAAGLERDPRKAQDPPATPDATHTTDPIRELLLHLAQRSRNAAKARTL